MNLIKIIASSSKGNCYKYFDILIDVGVSFKALKDDLKGVNYIVLTHEHGDHFKKSTIKRIAKECPHIYWITPSYLVDSLKEFVRNEKIIVVNWRDSLVVGNNELTCFKLYHDVPNSGYLINNLEYDYKIFHATDTQHLEGISVEGCDFYGVECNYSENKFNNMRLKKDNSDKEGMDYWLISNSSRTHLSDIQFNKFIDKNNTKNGVVKKYHQSSRNL